MEQDQSEGHKALLELEKIFNKKPRSGVLGIQGSQIKALSNFTQFFERYPYPVIINAAILKLADWFRTYNNTVKYYVYKVFKQASDLHLAKLINVEETVRRILPVLGSNDTIARSITLRMLGCMSMVIADKLDVQYGQVFLLSLQTASKLKEKYSIIQQLELATDRIELEAAIWAGDQICSKSSRFPAVIFSKIVNKLENPNTPFDIKLRLVKIFRHMHQDIGMARQAKLTCLVLLEDPKIDTPLTMVTLRTLTLLLSQAIIDKKEQIDRLLNYALNDPREEICYHVLYDLVLLGKNDIMFDETHILRLLELITRRDKRARIQQKAFQCAQTLIETHQKLLIHIASSTPKVFKQHVEICEQIMLKAIQEQRYTTTIASARFLYSLLRIIISYRVASDGMDVDISIVPEMKQVGQRVTDAITHVDIGLIKQDVYIQHSTKWKLRELLKIKANFCLLLDDWDCDAVFRNAFELLTSTEDETASVLLYYLSTISIKCQHLSSWFPEVALVELKKRMKKASVYVNLMRLLLRTTTYDSALSKKLIDYLYEFGDWQVDTEQFLSNGWYLYLIGMEAGCCGWYDIMYVMMKGLCKKVETEPFYYWLCSLSLLAYAEWQRSLQQPADYIKALIELKALQSFHPGHQLQFAFIQLRMESIQVTQLALNVLQSSRHRRERLKQCAVSFRDIAFRYDLIAQSGCDKETMRVIESYRMCALVCEHALLKSDPQFFYIDPSLIPLLEETTKEEESMIKLCREFLQRVMKWEELSHLDDQDRFPMCCDDMTYILETILSKPLVLPRSFFKGTLKRK